jgi:hypothetical protein
VLWAPCFQQDARDVAEKLGVDPLTLLEEVGRIAGIPVMVELQHPSDVDRAVMRADILVVGAANMGNALLLLQILTTIAAQSVKITQLLQTTQMEGREPSQAEMDELFADDDAARALLQKHIDEAKAAEAAAGIPPV